MVLQCMHFKILSESIEPKSKSLHQCSSLSRVPEISESRFLLYIVSEMIVSVRSGCLHIVTLPRYS